MNKQSFIFIPLIFLFTLAMFSMVGLNQGSLGTGYTYGSYPESYLYDWTGRAVLNVTDLQPVAEKGAVVTANINGVIYASWQNTTFNPFGGNTVYLIYSTSAGNSTGASPILYQDFEDYAKQQSNNDLLSITASFSSSYGMIALFISLMVAIGLAGIHFLGIGESETSLQTIFIGTGFIAIWAVLSVISLELLSTIPNGYGAIFYFGLTASYVIGLIFHIGK